MKRILALLMACLITGGSLMAACGACGKEGHKTDDHHKHETKGKKKGKGICKKCGNPKPKCICGVEARGGRLPGRSHYRR